MMINIPVPCPRCGGKMYSVSYDVTIKILAERSWHVCKDCRFTQDTRDFKKELCCA